MCSLVTQGVNDEKQRLVEQLQEFEKKEVS